MKLAIVLLLAVGACSSASVAPLLVAHGDGGEDASSTVKLAAGCPKTLTMENESSFEGESCSMGGLLCGGEGGFCWIQCVSAGVEAGADDADVTGEGHWTGCPGGP